MSLIYSSVTQCRISVTDKEYFVTNPSINFNYKQSNDTPLSDMMALNDYADDFKRSYQLIQNYSSKMIELSRGILVQLSYFRWNII